MNYRLINVNQKCFFIEIGFVFDEIHFSLLEL